MFSIVTNAISMFRLIISLITAVGLMPVPLQADDAEAVPALALTEIPQWIVDNVAFPEQDCELGIAGKEKFVISTDWTGRIFIASPLNTLHPSYEKEILDVVSRAPRCKVNEVNPDDLYQSVEIDFSSLIPKHRKQDVKPIGDWRPASFSPDGNLSPFDDGRDLFIDWICENCCPERFEVCNYSDTLELSYVVRKDGRVCNVKLQCSNSGHLESSISTAVESAIKKLPKWKPAVTSDGENIEVNVYDRVVVGTDTDGRRLPWLRLVDDTQRNLAPAPCEDIVVLNPQTKAFVKDGQNIGRLLNDKIRVGMRTPYKIQMVIEKDGTVSEAFINDEMVAYTDSVSSVLKATAWEPALQGGEPVRTICVLRGNLIPSKDRKQSHRTHNTDRYGSFMGYGRYVSFYDADYEKAQRIRWAKLVKAYPSLQSDIYGYSKFRRMNRNEYLESLIVRGR